MASKNLTYKIFGKDVTGAKALQNLSKKANTLSRVFVALGGVIAATFAVRRITNFAKSTVAEFAQAEDSQDRLTDAFSRFPKQVNLNIGALQALNTELQNKTRFDDDALAASEATLLQYKLTSKQVADLIPLVADYAAKTGKDLPSATKAIGLALLGNGRALKQIGVNFKDTGSKAGNYAAIMDILTEKVGGFAERDGAKLSTLLLIVGNQFGELKETVGGLFAPAVKELAGLMATTLLPRMKDIAEKYGPPVQSFFEKAAKHATTFVDALLSFDDANFSNMKSLADSAARLSPAFVVISGIATTLAPVAPQLADGFSKLGKALTDEKVLDALVTLVVTVLPPLVDLLVALTPLIPPLAQVISGVLVPAVQLITADLTGLEALFSGNVDAMKDWLNGMLKLKGPVGDFVRFVADTFIVNWNRIAGAANLVIGAIEAVINALSFLTGAKVHIPRLSTLSRQGLMDLLDTSGPSTVTAGAPHGAQYASGGYFAAKPGGYVGVIGEGRHDEVALPLSAGVYSRIGAGIEAARGDAKSGDTYVFNVSGFVGDENKLMQTVARYKRRATSRGAIPSGALA